MGFASQVDHFGILALTSGAGTLADVLKLTNSTKTPRAMSRAEARDENNDIAAATWYGNTADELFDASSEFVCKSGSFLTSVLFVGEVEPGELITGIEIGTNQDGWPTVTVTGILGTEAIVAPSGYTSKFMLPELTIAGAKRAQLLGFTVTAGCKLTSASISAAAASAEQPDGDGEPIAHGVSGGVLTGSASFVGTTGNPAWTVTLTDAEETQAPGSDRPTASYDTGTGSYEYILTRLASA